MCLSQLLLHKECPGCGLTRGVMHAIHFDFEKAWGFNKLFVIVLPTLLFVWCKQIIKYFNKSFFS